MLAGINVAFGKRDFEEALRIARKPRSGVKVTYLCRDARGRIVALTIASRDGCTVAMMQRNSEMRRPRTGAQQPGTASIQLGQTIDEVVAALGQPEKAVNLGSKQIYVYKDLKVTFVNGKVSDVQ